MKNKEAIKTLEYLLEKQSKKVREIQSKIRAQEIKEKAEKQPELESLGDKITEEVYSQKKLINKRSLVRTIGVPLTSILFSVSVLSGTILMGLVSMVAGLIFTGVGVCALGGMIASALLEHKYNKKILESDEKLSVIVLEKNNISSKKSEKLKQLKSKELKEKNKYRDILEELNKLKLQEELKGNTSKVELEKTFKNTNINNSIELEK